MGLGYEAGREGEGEGGGRWWWRYERLGEISLRGGADGFSFKRFVRRELIGKIAIAYVRAVTSRA
jgi:hypothetical protein